MKSMLKFIKIGNRNIINMAAVSQVKLENDKIKVTLLNGIVEWIKPLNGKMEDLNKLWEEIEQGMGG